MCNEISVVNYSTRCRVLTCVAEHDESKQENLLHGSHPELHASALIRSRFLIGIVVGISNPVNVVPAQVHGTRHRCAQSCLLAAFGSTGRGRQTLGGIH